MHHPEMTSYRCTIMRGGTSKGIFIMSSELPSDRKLKDKIISAIFGSPDLRQIDGLGGADTLTSKLAIIGPSTHPNADIDYTFGQVSIISNFVDYKGNCGNISSAVGPFAIDEGLVKAVEPITIVRIHLTNSGNILVAEVPVKDSRACVEGDLCIDGCPGSGARITLDWSDTAGAFTGKLLPTGNPTEIITVDGKDYEVSLVDCANPLVFIRAQSLGMKGNESAAEIDANKELCATIEKIRSHAAVIFGLVDKPEDASRLSPYNPFFSIVSEPSDYVTPDGKQIKSDSIDIVSRLLFMLKMHKTHPGTGTVCLGVAARIPGTIVNKLLKKEAHNREKIYIGHPAGIIPVESKVEEKEGSFHVTRAAIYRTARRILDGNVYVKNTIINI